MFDLIGKIIGFFWNIIAGILSFGFDIIWSILSTIFAIVLFFIPFVDAGDHSAQTDHQKVETSEVTSNKQETRSRVKNQVEYQEPLEIEVKNVGSYNGSLQCLITVTNNTLDNLYVNYDKFTFKDGDNIKYKSTYKFSQQRPIIKSNNLAPGEKVKGWLAFDYSEYPLEPWSLKFEYGDFLNEESLKVEL